MIFQNAEFHNVAELIEDTEQGGYRILRIPKDLVGKLNQNAQGSAYFTCGCELRFNLNSEEAVIYLRRDKGSPDIMPYGIAEVWQGDHQGRYQLSPQPVGQDKTAIRIRKQKDEDLLLLSEQEHPLFDPKLYRVFIPYDWGHAIYGIEGDISLPEKAQVPKKTLLCYGSSITHGGGVSAPTASYAHLLSTKLSMDLRNLGMAGAAHMDEAMADYICQEAWDMATLELGINVLHWDLNEFEKKARHFITKIAQTHPDKPIFCISLFTSCADLNKTEQVKEMRNIIKQLVTELSLPKLHYIDGSKCLTSLNGLSSDALHPSNIGMAEIAEKLYQEIV